MSSSSRIKTLVIIPAYNEAENIVNVINTLQHNVPNVDYIIINDCSKDNTEEICKEKKYNYLSLPCNLGIGGAVQTGYQYAAKHGYDIAIQLDGDGQHDPKYIEKLIEPIENGKADIVIGSRYITYKGFQSTGLRRFGISFLSHLIKAMCGLRIKDVTSGYRAVNQKFIEFYSKDYSQDYPEPEAIVAAALQGGKICEIPVVMRDRQGGTSSIHSWKSIYYMIKVSLTILLYRITFSKKVV